MMLLALVCAVPGADLLPQTHCSRDWLRSYFTGACGSLALECVPQQRMVFKGLSEIL